MSLNHLMITTYENDTHVLIKWCEIAGISDPTDTDLEKVNRIIKDHLDTINVISGAEAVLKLYSAKGYRLALMSNSTQTFRDHFLKSDLAGYFEEIVFSCDIHCSKPNVEAYEYVAGKLGLAMDECLFVGDSNKNDYLAPQSFGMRAYHAKPGHLEGWLPSPISKLLWSSITDKTKAVKPLINEGNQILIDETSFDITSIESVNFDIHGKYNYVLRCHCKETGTDNTQVVYLKRYLHPEASYVEHLAYEILRILELSTVRSAVLSEAESILVTTEIDGAKWVSNDMDADIAYSAGQHCAIAYLLANADHRPRNTLISTGTNGNRVLNVLDLEHCFFDRAIITETIIDKYDPRCFDQLEDEIESFTKTRALSDRAIRRTRKQFLKEDSMQHEFTIMFAKGWHDALTTASAKATEIETALRSRIYSKPPIVIGTNGYRRAMSGIDIDDIMHRIHSESTREITRIGGFINEPQRNAG